MVEDLYRSAARELAIAAAETEAETEGLLERKTWTAEEKQWLATLRVLPPHCTQAAIWGSLAGKIYYFLVYILKQTQKKIRKSFIRGRIGAIVGQCDVSSCRK